LYRDWRDYNAFKLQKTGAIQSKSCQGQGASIVTYEVQYTHSRCTAAGSEAWPKLSQYNKKA